MFVSLIYDIIIVINHFVYTPSSRVIYNCFSHSVLRNSFFLTHKERATCNVCSSIFHFPPIFLLTKEKRLPCQVTSTKPTRARALLEEIIPIKVSCSLRVQVYKNTAAFNLNLSCTVNWIFGKNNSAVTMKVLITFIFQRTCVCNPEAKAYTPSSTNEMRKTLFNACSHLESELRPNAIKNICLYKWLQI